MRTLVSSSIYSIAFLFFCLSSIAGSEELITMKFAGSSQKHRTGTPPPALHQKLCRKASASEQFTEKQVKELLTREKLIHIFRSFNRKFALSYIALGGTTEVAGVYLGWSLLQWSKDLLLTRSTTQPKPTEETSEATTFSCI